MIKQTKPIRVSKQTYEIIAKVNTITKIPMTQIIDIAIAEFQHSKTYAQIMLFAKGE